MQLRVNKYNDRVNKCNQGESIYLEVVIPTLRVSTRGGLTPSKSPVAKEGSVVMRECPRALVRPQNPEDALGAVHPLDHAPCRSLVQVLAQELLQTELPPRFHGQIHRDIGERWRHGDLTGRELTY